MSEMDKKKSKAQSWSIDIVFGAIIFIGAFFVFYALLSADPNAKVSKLKDEASLVIKKATTEGSEVAIIDNNELNVYKVNQLKNLSYDELKRRLRIESDFCLYFEDEKGYIVLVNNSYKGIGAPGINLSGTPCSQK